MLLVLFVGIVPFVLSAGNGIKTPYHMVDPFIGTGGHGHTYPGAALPFGMVQLSPDTRLTGWDGCSGYHYSDRVIYGFSHTHLSGTGVSDYGDILLMPTTGKIQMQRGTPENTASGYCSTFSHANESASPGYYRILLRDYNIDAQLTVTPRTGIHRYTFPKNENGNIIIDLTHRDKLLDCGISIKNNREIHGFRRSSAWARDQHVYFAARFSTPFQASGIHKDKQGKSIKAYVQFEPGLEKAVVVKLGISAVSIEGALKNLEAEAEGKTFALLKRKAKALWQKALNKITIEGGSREQQRIFYTALYHSMLNPNLYTDIDGRYRGMDLKVHQAADTTVYTVFSLWDTFRATHPLFTLIEQQRTTDFIKTFLLQYRQGGLLPVWELAANETFCMIGYHAVPVIADAYIKGIRGYDIKEAYEAMKHSAQQDHHGLKHYKQMGFIPAGEEPESVSKTLEYAYDDWCIAQVAKVLGKKEDYNYYIQRSQFYKNLFDPSTGFLRAKMKGSWFKPFDPTEVNFNYTEANAWQYRFAVPHDIQGLIGLMGGKKAFTTQLDKLFHTDSRTSGRKQADITGLIGQYAHGNEPSHHMAYLYNYVHQPWKTQHMVRRILDTLYTDKPDGLCGNEDCGQMSAWYVLSAMGFYPVTPGQQAYDIGTPIFKRVSIHLENKKTFTIVAKNVSDNNYYIQSAKLNGQPWNKSRLNHDEIIKGGTLKFNMGSKPAFTQIMTPLEKNVVQQREYIPLPYVAAGSGPRTFETSTQVKLESLTPGAHIHYTLDGTPPNKRSPRYTGVLTLKQSTIIKAIVIKGNSASNHIMSARFDRIPKGREIRLVSNYAPQYSAGGDRALIDGIRGSGDFRTGTWQGYEGTDLEAIVKLGKETAMKSLSIGFLQDNNAWIFMPEKVEFFLSQDGKTFTPAAQVKNDIPARKEGSIIKQFTAALPAESRARYIKVKATAMGFCPTWHKGAGNKSWIFSDEIIIHVAGANE